MTIPFFQLNILTEAYVWKSPLFLLLRKSTWHPKDRKYNNKY